AQKRPTCTGGLQIRESYDLEALQSCTTYSGAISITSLSLPDLVFPHLQYLDGIIAVNNNDRLRRLSFPHLKSATRISVVNQTLLTTLEFPSLQKSEFLLFKVLPSLTDLSFSMGLNDTGSFEVADTGITSLNGLDMKNTKSLRITDNRNLVHLRLPYLRNTDELFLSGNGQGTIRINAPSLNSLRDLTLRNVGFTSLPGLGTISNDLVIEENSFDSFSIPNLGSVSGTLTIRSSPLKSICLPELQSVGGSVVISNNPNLQTITGFPKLKQVNGFIDITGSFRELDLSGLQESREKHLCAGRELKNPKALLAGKKERKVITGKNDTGNNNSNTTTGMGKKSNASKIICAQLESFVFGFAITALSILI
ncbi:5417_t:CDS:2, partial [Acaulospora colombiana]